MVPNRSKQAKEQIMSSLGGKIGFRTVFLATLGFYTAQLLVAAVLFGLPLVGFLIYVALKG